MCATRARVWFCTEEGLSRSDGYTFTNYTTEQGLPGNWVDDFLETRSGVFLIATYEGLCVFDPMGVRLPQNKIANHPNVPPMFTVYRPGADEIGSNVKVLFEDSSGNIWCGTLDGLYRIDIINSKPTFQFVELRTQSNAFDRGHERRESGRSPKICAGICG